MNIVAFVLMLIAVVVFVLGRGYRGPGTATGAAGERSGWYNNTDLGLAFLTAGLIVEFAAKSHAFHL
jgi:hypothetical protein